MDEGQVLRPKMTRPRAATVEGEEAAPKHKRKKKKAADAAAAAPSTAPLVEGKGKAERKPGAKGQGKGKQVGSTQVAEVAVQLDSRLRTVENSASQTVYLEAAHAITELSHQSTLKYSKATFKKPEHQFGPPEVHQALAVFKGTIQQGIDMESSKELSARFDAIRQVTTLLEKQPLEGVTRWVRTVLVSKVNFPKSGRPTTRLVLSLRGTVIVDPEAEEKVVLRDGIPSPAALNLHSIALEDCLVSVLMQQKAQRAQGRVARGGKIRSLSIKLAQIKIQDEEPEAEEESD